MNDRKEKKHSSNDGLTQNIRSQIRDLDIQVEKFEMPKEYRGFDDFTLVTDLRKSNEVLIIGGNASFPTLKRLVSDVTTVRKNSELSRLLTSGRTFDRIFIARENILSEELIIRAAQLKSENGLVCFFSEDSGLRDGFQEIVEKNYPYADVWQFKSNIGPLLVTNACGNPAGQD